MKHSAAWATLLMLVFIVGCSGDSGGTPAPRTPVPLPTRTPITAFGACSPLAMAKPVTYSIGQTPHSIATGDLNGDGRLDLIVTDPPSNAVVVLLGDGAGGFSPAAGSPIFVGREPVAAVAADFSGDGRPDLAIAHARSVDVWLLVNDGAAKLTPAPNSPFTVHDGPTALVSGDFNRDGKPDLALAFGSNAESGVQLLLGDGAAGFSSAPGSPVQLTSGPATLALDADDVDNDGILDLLVANRETDSVTLLSGDDTGAFRPPPYASFAVGAGPVALVTSDVNGDGVVDLTTANSRSNDVSVLLGDGKGAFHEAPGSPHEVIDGPISLTIADINGDGRSDVMVVVLEADDITILLGDGSGRFTEMPPPAHVITGGRPANASLAFAEFIAATDVNGDRKPDLVVANPGSSDVSVLVNGCP